MPLDPTKSVFWSCCSGNTCNGCDYANDKNNGGDRCPCCREVSSEEECNKKLMERIEANDPVALHQLGGERFNEGDYEGAFEYLTKAAELGDNAGAHYRLGLMYEMGNFVDKDEEKMVYHWEKAAIGGHLGARNNLGVFEAENGNMKRSVKHFVIAANLGDEDSMKGLWRHNSEGNITKEELDATLRTHQAAIDGMKSPEREAADEYPKTQAAIDKKLFTQPSETHLGECPICFLPLSIDPKTRIFWTCCSETICNGCVHANMMSNGRVKAQVCVFCREPSVKKEESNKRLMKRVKANDPAALRHCGGLACYEEGDYDAAFKYWTKAAELGDIQAHHELGFMYIDGRKGIEKDGEKSIHHYEKAAIGGHPQARQCLALYEEHNGNVERAVKHYIIAANLGYETSMKTLWKHYSLGNITKEDLNATLRAHQAAIDATKSEQREKVAEAIKNGKCPIFGGLH
jgi:TPR repeat protein